MKKGNVGCVMLEVYPQNPNSLLILSLDELKLPEDVDFGSIKAAGDKGALLSELIEKSGHKKILDYSNKTEKTHIAIINNGSRTIRISYRCSGNSRVKSPKSTVKLSTMGINLALSTRNVALAMNKTGSISEFLLAGKKYGPMHLAASGGDIFYQEQHDAPKIDVIADGSIIKIIKAESILKVLGSSSKKKGYFPFSITYTFWSPDGSGLYCTAEIELKFDEAYSFENRKLKYIDLMMWYRLENCLASVKSSALHESKGPDSSIVTLGHPYSACIESHKNAVFGMFPYLALPCDGIHIEKGRNFFGPCWHSLPSEGKPYWTDCGLEGDKPLGDNQGYFPANSLRSYWKIGLYFGNGIMHPRYSRIPLRLGISPNWAMKMNLEMPT
ncbi:hypothetical protein HYT54_01170 [Candidatus Woesearchaeota archaeon]|nr:hypothetical protein [Candidatus Woesearchaeota archaeon]